MAQDQDKAQDRKPSPRRRRWKRLRRVVALLVLLAGAGLVAAPWLLSTTPVRQWLVGQAGAVLAPGKVELAGLSLSWVQPMELTGLTLVDPHGKRVLAARRIGIDRGLLSLMSSRSDYGTITVEGAAIDLERRADGTIDLLDALGSVLKPSDKAPDDPGKSPVDASGDSSANLAVRLLVRDSAVRILSPELAEPLVVSRLAAEVTIAPGQPLQVSADLAHDDQALRLKGHYDHRAQGDHPGDLALTLQGKAWPLALRHAGVTARGRLDGELAVALKQGLWNARGDLALSTVEADGPALGGDRLVMDKIVARADVDQTAAGWTIPRLEVTSPVGGLTASGTVPAAAGAPTHLEGSIDLAALARMVPHAMRLRDGLTLDRGLARIQADLKAQEGTEHLSVVASLANLAATEQGRPIVLRAPIALTASASRTAELITVEKLEVKAAGIDVTAQGDLDRGVALSGTIDLATLKAQLGDLLDLGGVDLSGRAGLAADYRRAGDTYQARFATECRDLRITGLTEQPFQRDRARFDASAVGPRADSGLPADWQTVRVGLKAGDVQASLTATSQAGAIAVAATASADVTTPTPSRAEAKVALRWKDRVATIDDLRAGLVPTDPQAAVSTVALALQGRLDLDRGELALTPIAGVPPGALGLVGEGLRVTGLGKTDVPLKVDAALVGDLAGCDRLLAAWSGSSLLGLGGAWTGSLAATRVGAGRVDFGARVDIANLTTPEAQGPIALRTQGSYAADADRLELPLLDLTTSYGHLVADLRIGEFSTQRMAALRGTLKPSWEKIDGLIAESLEPKARVRGSIRPITLQGSLAGGSVSTILRGMQGEVGLDLASAHAFGMAMGPTPVVLRLGNGRAVFDPIRTTLNGGMVALQADLALDDPNALSLRLAPGSKIDRAAINDDVSSSVLAYIAPVLSQATQVSGTVSVAIQRASIPILGAGSTLIEGQVAFQNVQCQPGPFAAEILAASGQRVPKLGLNQPLQLQVADGRVRQSGLSIDVARDSKIDLQGSVGFDQTIQLQAVMPLPSRMLPRDERVQQIAGGTRVTLPIGGTLKRPKIDRQALEVALRDAAKSMVKRGLESGASDLLNRIIPPEAGSVRPGTGGGTRPATGTGNVGRDALKLLEGLGREALEPRKP